MIALCQSTILPVHHFANRLFNLSSFAMTLFGNFIICHFVNLKFYHSANLPICHLTNFANLTFNQFRQSAISFPPFRQYIILSFYQLPFYQYCYFANFASQPYRLLPFCHFTVCDFVNLPFYRFAITLFCHCINIAILLTAIQPICTFYQFCQCGHSLILYFYIFSTANHDDHLSQPEEHHRDQWRGTAVDRPSPRWLTTTLTVTASTPASEILLIQPSRPSMTANPCRYFKAHIFLSLFKNFKLANPGLFFVFLIQLTVDIQFITFC